MIQILHESMNALENDRYDVFRSSKVPDNKIKRIIQSSLGNSRKRINQQRQHFGERDDYGDSEDRREGLCGRTGRTGEVKR